MSRASRLSTLGLLTRQFGSGVAGSLLVALLIAAAVLAAALAPRALATIGTAELRYQAGQESPALLDLSGTGRIGVPADLTRTATVDDFFGESDSAIRSLRRQLPEPLRTHARPAQWVASTGSGVGGLPSELPLNVVMSLSIDLEWESRIRFVDGIAPEAWQGTDATASAVGDIPVEQPPIPIAISENAAAELDLGVGSVIGYGPAPTIVTGIYELIDPDDAYWVNFTNLGRVTFEPKPGELTTARVLVYVDPRTIAGLQRSFASGPLKVVMEIDPRRMDYSDAAVLRTQTRQLMVTEQALPLGGRLEFQSGLPEVITAVLARVTSAASLLAFSVSGLLGVLLGVFALSVQSVITRRRSALALAAARGAGNMQLRIAMVLEGLLLSVPGAALALALAPILVPARLGVEGWVLPGLVALAPSVLFGVLTSPRRLRTPRDDLQVRARSSIRWIVETAVIALGVLSLFLLARRGLVASSEVVGIDPLLAATPLLFTAAVSIAVLRVYPAVLLGVQRRLRRRRGSAAILGAARAVRDPVLGLAAALALVVGISIVVFSTVMATTVRSGIAQGALDVVGADVQVSARRLPPPLLKEIGDVDRVRAVAPVAVATGVDLDVDSRSTEVILALADTEALHQVRPDIPALTTKVGDRIPLVVSSDWAERTVGADLAFASEGAISRGTISADALPGVTRLFVLVDSEFAREVGVDAFEPERALIRLEPGASASAVVPEVTRIVTAAQAGDSPAAVKVSDSQSLVARTLESPTVASLESSLVLAALASLLLAMLTVLLASIAAATVRNRLVGVLRILGMSRRQLRSVQSWELGPIAVTAIVVGTALGLVLPVIVTGALDLRPFVGGRSQPIPSIEPLWVIAAVGSFAIIVALAGTIASALGRRLAPAGTLKMGEG